MRRCGSFNLTGTRPRAQAVAQILRKNEFSSVDQLRLVEVETWLQGERLTGSEVTFMQGLWDKQVFSPYMLCFSYVMYSCISFAGAAPRLR